MASSHLVFNDCHTIAAFTIAAVLESFINPVASVAVSGCGYAFVSVRAASGFSSVGYPIRCLGLLEHLVRSAVWLQYVYSGGAVDRPPLRELLRCDAPPF
jgi:hypothetical protein